VAWEITKVERHGPHVHVWYKIDGKSAHVWTRATELAPPPSRVRDNKETRASFTNCDELRAYTTMRKRLEEAYGPQEWDEKEQTT
jgi:hypothetical protein